MRTEESLKAVFNTSPIIVLSKLGLLKDAIDLFGEVEVSSGVIEELSRKKNRVYQELMEAISEGKVRLEDVRKRLPRLGLGESSTIFLALIKNKTAVLDDRRARRLARELGLDVIGTLSILKKLYDKGVISETPNMIYKRLIEIGFYIDKKLFDKIFGRKL